ncbi:hypothetical protein ACGFX8_36415 [Streptomyces sp. NPDC048362]|uniref:hypothetical protein n=1 Tax=Streptomyces sp. NPDC048362 TaxID=3365539 RepID=UPI00371F240F
MSITMMLTNGENKMTTPLPAITDLERVYLGALWIQPDSEVATNNFATLACCPLRVHERVREYQKAKSPRSKLVFGDGRVTDLPGGHNFPDYTGDDSYMPFVDEENASLYVPDIRRCALSAGRVQSRALALHELGHLVDASRGYPSQGDKFRGFTRTVEDWASAMLKTLKGFPAYEKSLISTFNYMAYGGTGRKYGEELFAEGFAQHFASVDLQAPDFFGPSDAAMYGDNAVSNANALRELMREFFEQDVVPALIAD